MPLRPYALHLTFLLPLLFTASLVAQPPQAGKYSAAEFQVRETRDERVAMRDGVSLVVDVFRPEAEGRFPVVLLQTPYNKDGFAPRAKWFAARGYAVVNVDSRGRLKSEGEWDPFTPQHKTDGFDLVEWAARQPWSTGKVGTYGLSYMGWTQWWTATQTPPALKCMVPEVAPPDQFYNAPYQNGIFVLLGNGLGRRNGEPIPNSIGPGPYGGFGANRDKDYLLTPYIELDDRRKYGHTKWYDTWIRQNLATGEYWRAIAYQTPDNYARVKVPTLAISGWFDANFPGTPMNYLGMKRHGGTPEARRPRLVIGPWEHIINRSQKAADTDFGPQAIIDWDGYVCRWFDYHLKGIDNGVLADPPVHVFVMGRNEWRAAADWPLPGTKFTHYYLHSAGKANSSAGDGALNENAPSDEPADHYTYDPASPTPSAPFANGHIDGPRDIRASAARADVLVYTTPPLEQEVVVVGPITAHLYAATSARDTDWMVRLVDVHPDGYAAFLAEGVMRSAPRPLREGAFNAGALSTIEPGQVYPYTIEFWRPTGNAFAAGHRIRIEISSSYFPYFLRNLNTGADNIGLETRSVVAEQTIHHDAARPSHVVLPVIPAQ